MSLAAAADDSNKIWEPPDSPITLTPSIPVRDAGVHAADDGKQRQVAAKAVERKEVKETSATIDLAKARSAARVQATGLPVWLAPADPMAPRVEAASGSVDVTQLSSKAAGAAGVDGLLVKLEPKNVKGADKVQVALDVSALDAASAGAFSQRGRLVLLPSCALTTPNVQACRTKTPVAAHMDADRKQVLVDVDLSAQAAPSPQSAFAATGAQPGAGPVLLAQDTTASGGGGDYKASDLNPSAGWSAGSSSGGMTYSYAVQSPPTLGGQIPTVSLGYNSSSVDGKTSATNSQASWIGDGWDYTPGFIERTYKPCDKAGITDSGDLCWAGQNATMSLGGHSGQLVRDDNSGVWRLKDDDGTKIEFRTGASNGAENGEYVKVTDTSGNAYYFGANHLPAADGSGVTGTGPATNSVSTVPVYSPAAGDPCNAKTWCQMAQRWGLDYIVDAHGNLVTVTWSPETNSYSRGGGQNKGTGTRTAYVRANLPARIAYGQLLGEQLAAGGTLEPAARIDFKTAERCLADESFDCDPAKRTVANKLKWPDVPVDQECKADGACTNVGPTFFTTRRLVGIDTAVRSNNTWKDVDSYVLTQSFPPTGDAGGEVPLWLDRIQRTGKASTADSPSVPLPPVSFGYQMLPNRVDGVASSANGATFLDNHRPRIDMIQTETGGTLHVDYELPGCSRLQNVMPRAEDDNDMACFPVRWTPPGSLAGSDPILDWFNHYRVKAIYTEDLTGTANKDTVTAYTYGKAAWHRDDSEYTDPKSRTWNDFRGFATVTASVGSNDSPQTKTRTTYLQGMNGDRTRTGTRSVTVADVLGESVTDDDWLSGQVLQSETFDNAADTAASAVTVNRLTAPQSTATHTKTGSTTLDTPLIARYADTVSTSTTKTKKTDGSDQVTSTMTTKDPAANNRVTSVLTKATALPDTCVRTTYATGPDPQRTDLVAETLMVSGTGACTAKPAAGNTLSGARAFYDGKPYQQAGATADPTSSQVLGSFDGTGTACYVATSTTTYDTYGRVANATDLLSTDAQHPKGTATTTTAYTVAAAGELPTSVTSTSPAPGSTGTWSAVTTLDPRRNLPTAVTDANGKTVNEAYDALGRLTEVWLPGRATSASANLTYAYALDPDRKVPTYVTSSSLTSDTTPPTYHRSIAIMDGLGRVRQTQGNAVGTGTYTGRLISDTLYDSHGRAYKTNAPWFNSSGPSGALVVPDTAPGQSADDVIPSQTVLAFDGRGRTVASTFRSMGADQWSTTTAYPGADRVDTTPPKGSAPTTTITDARGRTGELWQYGTATPTGQAADATITRYTYTVDGKPLTRKDAAGNTWSYEYDQRGRQTKATDPDTGVSLQTWDDAGHLTSTTDARNTTLSYTYDLIGRKTGTFQDGTGAANQLAAWTFDTLAKGKPASSTRYTSGANGPTYTTAVTGYDNGYRPTGTTVTIPGTEVGQAAGTTFTYTTSSTYDQVTGNVQNTKLPAVGDLPREELGYSYGIDGILQSYSGLVWYPGQTNTSVVYDRQSQVDAFGRPTSTVVNPYGTQVVARTVYDQATGQTLSQSVDRQTQTAAPTQLTAYTYNPAGRVTSITDTPDNAPALADRQCFSYDALGRLTTAWTDKGGITTPAAGEHKALSQGACTNTTPTSGAVAPATNTVGGGNPYWQDYTYDVTGNRTSRTDHAVGSSAPVVLNPSQITQTAAAGDAGQSWGVALADGKVWTSRQNADGTWGLYTDLMAQAGPLSSVTSVSAAVSNGQLQVMAVAGGKIWHTLRKADGTWQAWGDVSSVVGALASPSQLALTATSSGLEVLTFSGGKLWHTLRKADGTWQTQGWGDVFSVVGTLSNPTQMAAAATGSGLEIGISAGGKLWHTVRASSGTWQAQGWGDVYSVTGALTGAQTGAGQLALANTTAGLQVVNLASGKPWHVIRNSAGQWTTWADVTSTAGAVPALTTIGAVGYGTDLKLLGAGSGKIDYSKRNDSSSTWSPWTQLIQTATPNTTTTSTYPAAGTANTPTGGGAGTGGAHALLGASSTGPSGVSSANLKYDAAGNTTEIADTSGKTTYTWNAEGRLAKTSQAAGDTTYLYDADGNQLIRRNPGGKTTISLGADEATYDLTTKTLSGTRYYPMPNGITAVRTGSAPALSFQISDHHGTGTLAIDSATLQVARRPSDPFGNPRGTQPTTWAGDHGFVGGTKDDTTGLTNLGARQYQPLLGRFLNPDPILGPADPQQWNGYAYSNNNPVSSSDPTGLYRVEGQDGGGDGTLAPGTTGEVPCDQSEACKQWQKEVDEGTKITTAILDQIPQDRLNQFRDHLDLIRRLSPKDWNVPGTLAYAALQKYAENALYGSLTLKDLWDGAKGIAAGLVVSLVGVALCPESGGTGCALAVGAMAGFASQCATNCSDKEALVLSTVAGAATSYAAVKLGGVGVKTSGCSFSPDTPVLLDNGEAKPIGNIALGDHVEAGDPTTGEHVGSREVTALHVNHDDDLIDLTISTPDGGSAVVHTTARHPFWDDTQKKWVPAGNLADGDALETSANVHVYVRSIAVVHSAADMFNLTVADLHTYYVLAGATPVLVHNDCGQPVFRGTTTGFSGSPGTQRVGITPTSSDPGVATIFATHSEQFGDSVVQIATPSDLSGVATYEGYIASEAEVGVELSPGDFARRASIEIPASVARGILGRMGISVPSRIGVEDLSPLLANTPKLTSEQVSQFIGEARAYGG
ncbi:polymorphic toxin-type HINT domain-containing protein [Kitasatospora sp. NPDC088783]|uniref:polymorphic toxin-type HINT domain-containing protein n=1 Tax=Kitasatospora sp. NPDC088783 TaxID=3364077 RepID=UPI00382BBC23